MATSTKVMLSKMMSDDVKQLILKKVLTKRNDEKDDPFVVCNVSKVVERYELWKHHFPNIKPFYAVKCNDDPVLLRCLANLGTGFDCASKVEINTVLDLGVQPNNIIFANPCKQQSHLKYAAKKDVPLMTFDNETELHKIAAHYPNAQLVIRIKADADDALVKLGAKFGCSMSEVFYLLQVAHRHLGLNVIGVSFHVGSDCRDPSAYRTAMDKAHQVFQYAEQEGCDFSLLDIGGGFTGNDSENDVFAEVAEIVNSRVEEFSISYPNVTVIAEPGRFFAASCFTLAVQVISKRPATKGEDTMYYINDGVYGTLSGVMYENAVVQPHKLMETPNEEHFPCSIWGPTCDSVDKIGCYFLPELFVGDWLLFYNIGAYSLASSTGFNGFARAEVVYYMQKDSSYGHCFSDVTQDKHLVSNDVSSREVATCS